MLFDNELIDLSGVVLVEKPVIVENISVEIVFSGELINLEGVK